MAYPKQQAFNSDANFTNYQVEDINNDHISSQGSALSEREMKLKAFWNCINEGSKNMTLSVSKEGFIINQQKAYINTVMSAMELFTPDLLNNKDLAVKIAKIDLQEQELRSQFKRDIVHLREEMKKKDNIGDKNFYINNRDILEKELDNNVYGLYREKVTVLSFLIHSSNFYADQVSEAGFDEADGIVELEEPKEDVKEETHAS